MRQITKSLFAIVLAITLWPTLLMAQPVKGGTLFAVVQPEPNALTGAIQNAFPNLVVSANIFDGLLTYDTAHKPQPGLAESWTVAKDGLTITFKLRKNVKWHDGVEFTAADVKFSLQEIWQKIHTRGRVTFASVKSVDTPDKYTVVLHLSSPSLVILSALNAVESQILPKHLYENTDIYNNPHNLKPVGTGAFKFKDWKKGQYIELERNADYWDKDKPYLDKVIFRVIPDAASRAVALENGEVQYAPFDAVPHADIQRLRKNQHLTISTVGYDWQSQYVFLEFNLQNPALNNVKVRQAFAYAINTKGLIETVWHGLGKPSTGAVPSTLSNFYTTKDVPQYTFAPDKAEQLLDEAGYPRKGDGTRFKIFIDYQPFNETYKFHAEYLRQNLKTVGIDAVVRSQDLPSFVKRVYTDYDYDVNTGQISPYLDPQIGIIRHYWSKSITKGVPWTNASGYSNPALDKIIEKIQVSSDQKERVRLFHELQRITKTDLPVLPLFEIDHFTVFSKKLHGLSQSPDAALSSLKGAWLEK